MGGGGGEKVAAGCAGTGRFKTGKESELRRNIEANKDMSYYYAHSTETPLPDSVRFVSGGMIVDLPPDPKGHVVERVELVMKDPGATSSGNTLTSARRQRSQRRSVRRQPVWLRV